MKPKTPLVAVDIIIEKDNRIVLIKRKFSPFKGKLALPGGLIEIGETAEQAAKREAKEETGLEIEIIDILGVYSDPKRDPRKHTISIVFIAKPLSLKLNAGDDAADAAWTSLENIDASKIVFDHGKIIHDYRTWKRKGGTYWSSK